MSDFNESLDVWEGAKGNSNENKITQELGPIIGIDLGSSNSCVSLWHTVKNRCKVVKNITTKSKYT
jgi:molecular chaperone DnaK (HSP70)